MSLIRNQQGAGMLIDVYVLSLDSCEIDQCDMHVWILSCTKSI